MITGHKNNLEDWVRFLCQSFLITLFCLSTIFSQTGKNIFNVQEFGAKGNGKTNDTKAIQQALEKCAQSGGGIVYLPPGNYVIGPIFLRNNVNLHLEGGATLWATSDKKLYFRDGKIPTTNPRGSSEPHTDYDLISGEDLVNVAITGRGTINGQGAKYWWGIEKFRPYILRLRNCTNVLFQDVTTVESPTHTFAFNQIQGLKIRGVALYNHPKSPNTDGFHIGRCKNVHISEVTMETGDDCIVISGGTTNLTITNSTFATPWGVLWISDGNKITMNNCVVECQMLLKDIRRAENVVVSNIVANGEGRLFSMMGGPAKNIILSDIIAYDFAQAGWLENAEGILLDNVRVFRKSGSGSEILYNGFELKNIRDLTLRNVQVRNVEKGPALICDQVTDLELEGFKASGVPESEPDVLLKEVRGANIRECHGTAGSLFMKIEGTGTENIHIVNNDLRGAQIQSALDVPAKALQEVPVKLSDLEVPKVIHAGEVFSVNVQVSNLEDNAGFSLTTLTINGEAVNSKWIWLEPGESHLLSLTVPGLYEPKTYKITVGNIVPVSRKVSPKPATFQYKDILLSSDIVKMGKSLDIKSVIQNVGSYIGTEEVKLNMNGKVVDQKTVKIPPGSTTEVVFSVPINEIGIHRFNIGNLGTQIIKCYDESLNSTLLELDFEELKNGMVIDNSGLENHVLLKSNTGGQEPTIGAGYKDKGLQFNGESAYCEIPKMLFRFPMTITMWLSPGSLTPSSVGGRQMILYASIPKGNDGFGPEDETHLARDAGDYLVFWNRPGKRFELRKHLEDMNRFYFISIVYDETAKLYINGEQVDSVPGLDKEPDFSAYEDRIYIGRPAVDYLRYFNGTIDELHFYAEALSMEEIQRLYQEYIN